MRYFLLVIIFISVSLGCRRLPTNTETFIDSLEVAIPRDTSITIKGSTTKETVKIDSILAMQENRIIKRYDSLNRSYLSMVRRNGALEVECNCLDTTVKAQLNDKLKTVTRKETKTVTIKQAYIPKWVWIVIGALAAFCIGLFATSALFILKR